MCPIEFRLKTQKLLKWSRRKSRWLIDPKQIGINVCDICDLTVIAPAWDLYPWKLESKKPSMRLNCKNCQCVKHLPLIRSNNLEKTQI